MENYTNCQCANCERNKAFYDAMAKLPDESARAFWQDIYSKLHSVEADLSYYKALVNGSWNNADAVIEEHRKSAAGNK